MAPPLVKSQPSFNSGELDPALLGRVDIDSYFKGLAKARNCYSLVTGGLLRRPGLEWAKDLHLATPTTSAKARFIPYLDGGVNSDGIPTGAILVFEENRQRIWNIPEFTLALSVAGGPTTDIDKITWTQRSGGDDIVVFFPSDNPVRFSVASGT